MTYSMVRFECGCVFSPMVTYSATDLNSFNI